MSFRLKAQIQRFWRRLRYGSGPQAVPKILDAATLQAVRDAARHLEANGVDIRALAAGEQPGPPRPSGPVPPRYGEGGEEGGASAPAEGTAR